MPRARERARRFGRSAAWLIALVVVLVPALSGAASAQGSGTYVGRLYFTTFQNTGTCGRTTQPCTPNVFRVDYAYNAGTPSFALGTPQAVATLPGADGIVFTPSGQDLLVGGQNSGKIFQVDPATGTNTSVQSGDSGSFHVALGPDGKQVWTSGTFVPPSTSRDPGVPATVPLNPLQNGTPHPLTGDSTQITQLAFVPSQPGIAYYTDSNWPGHGCFGTLNLSTFTTKCIIPQMAAAHGITYDPFTKDLILVGGNQIVQISPNNPADPVSMYMTTLTTGGVQARFDQAAVDNAGHLFATWNGGNLLFMDYSASGKVGSAQNFVATPYLHANLDDVVNEMPEVPFAGGLLTVALGLMLWTWRRRRRRQSDGDPGLSLSV